MFGNCDEKMLVISSNNTIEWPQRTMQTNNNRVADAKTFNNLIMASSSSAAAALPSARVLGMMEKTAHQRQQPPSQPQPQPQPQPQQQLKCPRCDSSNTKFCYYNNYSLSQPRHFCKACKRYWTRGGTLRNVPVGGGCRKNKRVKRPPTNGAGAVASSSSSLDGSSNSTTTSAATTMNPNSQISHFSSAVVSNGYMNPLFYGLQGLGDGNFPVVSDRFSNSKVSSSSGLDSDFGINGLNSLELGFLPLSYNHTNGLINNSSASTNKQFHHSSRNDPLFGSISSSPTPSVAALLASSGLHHQKLMNGGDIPRNTELLGSNHLQTLAQLQDLHVGGNNSEAAIAMNKEGKLDHQVSGHIGLTSDPSIYNSWNGGGVGAWLDPTSNNIGSSLTSLI